MDQPNQYVGLLLVIRNYLPLIVAVIVYCNWRNIISAYQTLQDVYRRVVIDKKLEPISRSQKILLCFVLALGVVQLFYPYISSEINIFTKTDSPLAISSDILRTRWLEYKGSSELSESDELLFEFLKLGGGAGGALYTQFGPDTVSECLFCVPTIPRSYFLFALPKIVAPYLVNWFLLAVVASDGISPLLSQWRTTITISHILAMVYDLSRVLAIMPQHNLQARELSQVTWYHWNLRINRGKLIFMLNFTLLVIFTFSIMGVLWDKPLQKKRRDMKYDRLVQNLTVALNGVKSNNVTFQSICRDDELRHDYNTYWEANDNDADKSKLASKKPIKKSDLANSSDYDARMIISKCMSD